MKLFITIGQSVKITMNGSVLYGQVKDGYLFMEGGVIKITDDAVIEEVKLDVPEPIHCPYETQGAATPYEIHCLNKYGNFLTEEESEHDELKQWHHE